MDQATRDLFHDQPQPSRFLIGHNRGLDLWMKTCPVARTYEGWSVTLDAWVLIAITCNRWSCPVCGRKKVQAYAKRVAEAVPNKLITLTVNPAMHDNPRSAYDATRRKISDLTRVLRKAYGEFEFFRILEVTRKGWPHYHLITRSPYIPQAELSELWRKLTGAPIVDVRALHRRTNAYWYVVKYLAKQDYIPWTDRRAAWTKKFFQDEGFQPGQSLEIPRPHFVNHHPADHARWCYEGAWLERYSDNCWIKRGSSADS